MSIKIDENDFLICDPPRMVGLGTMEWLDELINTQPLKMYDVADLKLKPAVDQYGKEYTHPDYPKSGWFADYVDKGKTFLDMFEYRKPTSCTILDDDPTHVLVLIGQRYVWMVSNRVHPMGR